jgi:hypothetical protein
MKEIPSYLDMLLLFYEVFALSLLYKESHDDVTTGP